jgi:hypothetical protein
LFTFNPVTGWCKWHNIILCLRSRILPLIGDLCQNQAAAFGTLVAISELNTTGASA